MILFTFIFTFIIWMLNLQFNPSLGNIWIRSDENGVKRFAFKNLINILLEPFKNIYYWIKGIPHISFWNPKMWDVNFYTLFLIFFGVFTIISLFRS